jgi:hypothetical protein
MPSFSSPMNAVHCSVVAHGIGARQRSERSTVANQMGSPTKKLANITPASRRGGGDGFRPEGLSRVARALRFVLGSRHSAFAHPLSISGEAMVTPAMTQSGSVGKSRAAMPEFRRNCDADGWPSGRWRWS